MAIDLLLDEDGDVYFEDGDFAIGDADQSHIEHIMLSERGNWFEHPFVGVGILGQVKSNTSRQQLKQNIRRQLVLDGFSVKEIKIYKNGVIEIDSSKT